MARKPLPIAVQWEICEVLRSQEQAENTVGARQCRAPTNTVSSLREESTISTFVSTWVEFGVPQSIFHYDSEATPATAGESCLFVL